MKKLLLNETFINILFGSIMAIILMLLAAVVTEGYYRHLAIIHHAAFYEADSWGNVSFHWNDVSYAQVPLNDEGWEKVQNSIFKKKLEAIGIQ